MKKIEWYEKIAEYIYDNIEDFYETFYVNSKLQSIGNSYRLNPCPVCGHSDCATIGTSVHCFSCDWKGTHINAWFEYATKNLGMTLSEAIKKLEEYTHIKCPIGDDEVSMEEV